MQTGVYFDQTALYEFSFANYPGETSRRITLPLKTLGAVAGHDRVVKAEFYYRDEPDNTPAPERLFVIEDGLIPTDSVRGNIYVTLKYEEILDDDIFEFNVRLIPSDDFPEVSYGTRTLRVVFSAQELRPENWSDLSLWFGTYSTRWWKFIKEATGRSTFPFKFRHDDPETWWMSQLELNQYASMIRRALRDYNATHDEPLTHDDGDKKDQEVVMP